MKSLVIICILACMVFLVSGDAAAQKNTSFQQKWHLSQLKADSTAAVFVKKYPDIIHHKVVFKTFYDSIAKKETVLDMFIEVPKGKGPFPVIIFIHGGGFVGGDKSAFTHQSYAVAQKGIVAVSIEYRLKGHGGSYADFIQDTMDAIDFIRNHAKQYHLDFSRLALSGGSAGGYLSSYAAMKTPECICYVGYNGLYDLEARDKDRSRFSIVTNKLNELSPIRIIKTPPPATLLLHGKEDTTVDPQQSIVFAEAIRAKGGMAEVILYDGQKHGFFNREPYLNKTTQTMVEHVVQILKP